VAHRIARHDLAAVALMRAGWIAVVAGVGLALAILGLLGSRPDDGLGPVARALALDRGSDLDARRAAAVGEAVGRCLARHGITDAPPAEPPPAVPDPELDPVAWAARWGFGITTASGWSPRDAIPPPAAGLAGPMVATCHEHAADEVYGLRERLLATLGPALTRLGAAIDADPATLAADRSWVACASAAVRAADPTLPVPSSPGRLDALRTWFVTRGDSRPEPSIIALERRVAVGIARCDRDHVTARRRAAEPHERAFVREHASLLARIGAAIRLAEAAYPSAPP
jgi:hypothetical protein